MNFDGLEGRGVAKSVEIIFEKIRIFRFRKYPSHLRQCRGACVDSKPQRAIELVEIAALAVAAGDDDAARLAWREPEDSIVALEKEWME